MILALVPIVGMYALALLLAIATLVATIADGDGRAFLGWLFLTFCLGMVAVAHFTRSAALVLRAARARAIEAGEETELMDVVVRTAAAADMPPPRVALNHSWAPNALAAGLTPTRATIAVTTELLRRLDRRELEAVIAHEISHIANRDGLVMTFVSGPAMAGAALWHAKDGRAKLFFPFYLPFYVLGLVILWTISRYREYTADRGAALITGAPENLMSALAKIAEKEPRGDLRGGAAVSALCIVPAQRKKSRLHFVRRFEIFMDHPPLEKRLRKLSECAREMGRPVR
jgi:heat shock protein HtpX